MAWGKTAPSEDPKKLAQEVRQAAGKLDQHDPTGSDTDGVIKGLGKLARDLEGTDSDA
jgi:hypothetical protein